MTESLTRLLVGGEGSMVETQVFVCFLTVDLDVVEQTFFVGVLEENA